MNFPLLPWSSQICISQRRDAMVKMHLHCWIWHNHWQKQRTHHLKLRWTSLLSFTPYQRVALFCFKSECASETLIKWSNITSASKLTSTQPIGYLNFKVKVPILLRKDLLFSLKICLLLKVKKERTVLHPRSKLHPVLTLFLKTSTLELCDTIIIKFHLSLVSSTTTTTTKQKYFPLWIS